MNPRLLDMLPEIYQKILPKLFSEEIAEETQATCGSCPMTLGCEKAMAKIPLQGFHPSTKCCSYQPGHVNYLVGGLLSDQSPLMAEGKKRMLARIEQRLGLPYGVGAPRDLKALYEAAQEGRAAAKAELVCGFYAKESGGTCTIWKHREAVCSTFFCKHDRGADGRRFWLAVKDFLELVEDQVSRYATYRVSSELFHRSEIKLQEDSDSDEMTYEEVWGEFLGREADFYRSTYEIVQSLDQNILEKIIGLDGMVESDRLSAAKALLDRGALPKRLKLSQVVESFAVDDQHYAVMGYLKSDALLVPKDLFDALSEFKTEDEIGTVLDLIAAKYRVQLDEPMLRRLVEHRILLSI
jgi:hypothetical protein